MKIEWTISAGLGCKLIKVIAPAILRRCVFVYVWRDGLLSQMTGLSALTDLVHTIFSMGAGYTMCLDLLILKSSGQNKNIWPMHWISNLHIQIMATFTCYLS